MFLCFTDLSLCSTMSCHYGTCQYLKSGDPFCLCNPGFTGQFCNVGKSNFVDQCCHHICYKLKKIAFLNRKKCYLQHLDVEISKI